MTRRLGITLGDVTGVGPEVALKAVAAEAQSDDTKYLFIGDAGTLERLNRELSLRLPLERFPGQDQAGRFLVVQPTTAALPKKLAAGSPLAAKAAMAALRAGAEGCLRGELDGIVTAPVNKEAIIRAGHKNFVGQTEFLSQLAGAKRTAMMLLGAGRTGPLAARGAGDHPYFHQIGSTEIDSGKDRAGDRTRRASVPGSGLGAREDCRVRP